MVVITGAYGFVGSNMVAKLLEKGAKNLVVVDDFSKIAKEPNLIKKSNLMRIERSLFPHWLQKNGEKVETIFHLGARTDTTNLEKQVFETLNLEYSKTLWNHCTNFSIPFIYASSAATYGDGAFGYSDESLELLEKLVPLNPYAESKQAFDLWALKQSKTPPFWVGFKFFNVYGPNESHKGRMASVLFHAFQQIKASGKINLFKSHNPKYPDGGQLRDFIYVKDVCSVLEFFSKNKVDSGIYNLGTGTARTFLDLAKSVAAALRIPVEINFIETPIDIRNKYQYFTEATMVKLRSAGYAEKFITLEQGADDYIKNFLIPNIYA